MSFQKRILKDISELKRSGYPVEIPTDSLNEIGTIIPGPHGTPYEAGEFRVRIFIPPEYPYKSPSVGILHCYHPNIDFVSGSLCLDVLNATAWSPAFSLLNIVQQFIPQLLHYPNDADPLNVKAGRLRRSSIQEFEAKARQMTKEWATGEASPLSSADPEVIKLIQHLRELDEMSSKQKISVEGTPPPTDKDDILGDIVSSGKGGPMLLLESPAELPSKKVEDSGRHVIRQGSLEDSGCNCPQYPTTCEHSSNLGAEYIHGAGIGAMAEESDEDFSGPAVANSQERISSALNDEMGADDDFQIFDEI